MKALKLIAGALAIAVALLAGGCSSQKIPSVNTGYFNPETVCLSQGGDGTLIVRAWGTGASKGKALEQARRNALRIVIFNGFTKGVTGAERVALITEVNAAERYAYYFDPFFSEGGEYRKYAKEDGTKSERAKTDNTTLDTYSGVFVIDRSALKARLIKDGIINP